MDGRGSNNDLGIGGERSSLVEDVDHRLDGLNSAIALPVAADESLTFDE